MSRLRLRSLYGDRDDVCTSDGVRPDRRGWLVSAVRVHIDYPRLLLLLVAFVAVVAYPLIAISRHPVRVVDISVQASVLNGTKIYVTRTSTRADNRGTTYFNLAGSVDDPAVSLVSLEIRPAGQASGSVQSVCDAVLTSVFSCNAQLVLTDAPPGATQTSSFRLLAELDNSLLASGEIGAQVTSTVDTSRVTVEKIALLAALVQVLTFIFPPTGGVAKGRTSGTDEGLTA